ncbi:hypothetical protein DVA86_10650 [Streptomyces armeniacus]|uniref:Uncharacterized protein n=1 Tax=Streptomyces armeniacus TaxID=83291 RepID=A0A345XN23_9ACTN|nr:hypothetical protein DVA86_10650 [Streptomyces armeniacus]
MAAAALAATLLIAGCGSDDGGDSSSKESEASESQDKGGEENAPEEEAGTEVKAMDIQGGWTTEGAGSSALILVVAEQKALVTGKFACSGEVVDSTQPATLDLKCADGSTDYAKGTFKSFDGEKLTVAWDSGQSSTFTKSKTDPQDLPDPNGPPGADDLP